MKKNCFLFLLVLCAVSFTAYAEPMNLPAEIKDAFTKAGMPLLKEKRSIRDFTLKTLDGKEVTLSQLKGKIVFLNFWATWCPPCRAEMPSMEALHKRYQKDGLEFLAVDVGENSAVVSKFLKDYGYTFPVVLDTRGAVSGNYGIQAIPATFIIDRDNTIVYTAPGARQWNTPAIFTAFESLLKNGQ